MSRQFSLGVIAAILTIMPAGSVARAQAAETKSVTTQAAAEAKQREGKTGSSNKDEAKQLQELEKQDNPKPTPSGTPSGRVADPDSVPAPTIAGPDTRPFFQKLMDQLKRPFAGPQAGDPLPKSAYESGLPK